jgi:hypothetical protein
MKYFWILPLMGLVSGNFSYQLMSHTPDFSVAMERSYFQIVAVLICFFVDRLVDRISKR